MGSVVASTREVQGCEERRRQQVTHPSTSSLSLAADPAPKTLILQIDRG